mmetsp:Transcript_15678/g.33359  ORF Transcript_15678/g.33359 Transcript_15678/m.33359 type:complete len:212 (-) Transcript_15678:7-642(-)
MPIAAADQLVGLGPFFHQLAHLRDAFVKAAVRRNEFAILLPEEVPDTEVDLCSCNVDRLDERYHCLKDGDDAPEAMLRELVGEALQDPDRRLCDVIPLCGHVREVAVGARSTKTVHVGAKGHHLAWQLQGASGRTHPVHHWHEIRRLVRQLATGILDAVRHPRGAAVVATTLVAHFLGSPARPGHPWLPQMQLIPAHNRHGKRAPSPLQTS